jgi:hypothetical protein
MVADKFEFTLVARGVVEIEQAFAGEFFRLATEYAF